MKEEDKIINKLKEEYPIEDLVSFNETDIHEKLKSNAFDILKYKDLYNKELAILEDLKIKYEKLLGKKYEHYRFNDEKGWTKPEIENYALHADSKIIHMKRIIWKQQICVRFFETCWKGLEKMQWNMKTFQDVMKGNT